MMWMRTLVERLARGRSLVRRLPSDYRSVKIVVSPDSQLKYLRPGRKGFDAELLDIADQFSGPDKKVWDVGANVGVFSLASAARGAKVLSIEADPFLAGLLRRSLEINARMGLDVRVLCAAIAHSNGIGELMIAKRGRASNALKAAKGSDQMGGVRQEVTVPLLTMDVLMDGSFAPDFVKIDVEGAEIMVLAGAEKLLRDIRPVIYIEVSQRNAEEATAILHKANYKLFSPSDTGIEISECVFNTLAIPT
ncbi:MAG: FkbM family methyltransferase [Hyphomicrobiaceae bacterium]